MWLYHSCRTAGAGTALAATVQSGTAQAACPMRAAVDWLIVLVRKDRGVFDYVCSGQCHKTLLHNSEREEVGGCHWKLMSICLQCHNGTETEQKQTVFMMERK